MNPLNMTTTAARTDIAETPAELADAALACAAEIRAEQVAQIRRVLRNATAIATAHDADMTVTEDNWGSDLIVWFRRDHLDGRVRLSLSTDDALDTYWFNVDYSGWRPGRAAPGNFLSARADDLPASPLEDAVCDTLAWCDDTGQLLGNIDAARVTRGKVTADQWADHLADRDTARPL